MLSLIALISGLILLVGGVQVGKLSRAVSARRSAIYWTTAVAIVQLLGAASSRFFPVDLQREEMFVFTQSPHLGVVSTINALLGVIIVTLSPLRFHGPKTFGRILHIVAVGSLFLSSTEPGFLALLWAASVFLVDRELRSNDALSDTSVLFRIYQIPSVLLFAAGVGLLAGEYAVFGSTCVLLGIALRVALLPAHSWFLRFVENAPVGVVAAFSAPQLGVYVHLEVLHEHLVPSLQTLISVTGAFSAIIAAFLALSQSKVFRSIAYLIISQTSLIAFGLENQTKAGWNGAILAWGVLALSITGFLLAVASVRARRGPLDFITSSGHPEQLPRLSILVLILGLATVGVPLTLGFVAEDLLIQNSVGEHPFLGLSLILTTAINGIVILRVYFGLFTRGPYRPGEVDITHAKTLVYSGLLILLFFGEMFPQVILNWLG